MHCRQHELRTQESHWVVPKMRTVHADHGLIDFAEECGPWTNNNTCLNSSTNLNIPTGFCQGC